MLRRIVFIGIALLITLSTAQAPDTLWTKTYGGTSMDKSYSVQQTNDGGYIIAGYYTNYATIEDFYIVRTNAQGNPIWEKFYGGNYENIAHSVQQTTDGGYIVVGSTMSFGTGYRDVWLLKTDANGDTIWTKIYAWDNADNENTMCDRLLTVVRYLCGPQKHYNQKKLICQRLFLNSGQKDDCISLSP